MADKTLHVVSQDPYNGAPDPEKLTADYLTPTERFFVRSHGPVPAIDPANYTLTVAGLVNQPLTLSLADLAQFERVDLVALMQCAGNRRQDLHAHKSIAGELLWDHAALGNGQWGGVRLADVLTQAGVQPGAVHVAFTGLDPSPHDMPFGGSIPLEKAMQPEVLLADSLNGQPLPDFHGAPLRVVVPGYVGARSVKWLTHIHVQTTPSENYYQAKGYKQFAPEVTRETVDWSQGQMLGPLVVNSVMTQPTEGAKLAAGPITLRGYAVAGEGAQVRHVWLSVDGGVNWQAAENLQQPDLYGWCLWQHTLTLAAGAYQLVIRAEDSHKNTQPAEIAAVWNFKGYMNNAWQRVAVTVFATDPAG